MDVATLRELIRNLRAWQSVFESSGCDVIAHPDGDFISLWDVEYLYGQTQQVLAPRQRQAIRLCLYEGYREVDAALLMGVSPSNPILMYAAAGLRRLCSLVDSGELPRYGEQARLEG